MEVGERRAGTFRSALAHRDLRLLLFGYGISATGDWLYSVSLIVYVLEVSGSPAWVAITSVVRFMPVVVLGTFGGVIADRYDRKRVMIVSDLCRFVVMVALTIVALAEGPALAAAVCAGFSVTFASAYAPAVRAVVPTLAGEDDLAAANTLVSTIENVALALGPAIGGILLLLGNPAAAFGLNALTFLASAACNAAIRTSLEPPAGEHGETPPTLAERTKAGFRAVGSSTVVLLLVVLSIALTAAYGAEIVLYAEAATGILDVGEGGLSFMWAAIGVGGILAAGVTSRIAERPQLASTLAISAIVSAVPMLSLAFVRVEWIIFALLLVEGAAIIVADVVSVTMLQRTVSGDVLGRVFGILDSLMVAGIVVGSLLASLALEVVGTEQALIGTGAVLIVVTLLAFPRARGIDRTTAARAAELADRIAVLSRVPILEEAGRPALEALASATSEEHVTAGVVVIREGEPADDIFVVVDGTLAVTSTGELGRETALGELRAGDHFGEIGVLEGRPRTATVRATTDCGLYRISGDDFLRALDEAPRVSGRVLRAASARLARTHPSVGSVRDAGVALQGDPSQNG